MSDILEFSNREESRKWLYDHCLSKIWAFGFYWEKLAGQKQSKQKKRWKKRCALDGLTDRCRTGKANRLDGGQAQ